MADNVLIKLVQNVPVTKNEVVIHLSLDNVLKNVDKVYSYIVFKQDEFVVQFNISQTDKYNTLLPKTIITNIVKIIQEWDGNKTGIIGYGQPTIDIILEAFDPLVNKLAYKQAEHWKQYEHCDLCQICRLIMIQLYNKGYYLHKSLIEKSFVNEILVQIRKDRYKPVILSIQDVFYKPIASGSENLIFADIITDESQEIAEKEEQIREAEHLIFEEIKDIIIDLIGIRQWNEFYRDYTNGHTTAWSRKIMLKIKNHLNTLGLTRGKFNDKYYK